MSARLGTLAAALAIAVASGCLDPLVSDEVVALSTDSAILPASATVADLEDEDPVRAVELARLDGVDDLVPLLSAFANGHQVRYWSFGVAPQLIAPVYLVGRLSADGSFERNESHPSIFDVIPGDPGYSPFWQVFAVSVTDTYDGELLPSAQAIEEARHAGLVERPKPLPMIVNCPVVARDVRLDGGPGAEPVAPVWAYYRGQRVAYFTFMPIMEPDPQVAEFPVADVYVLRREGGEPLSEPLRRVDMTGDGDAVDSNNIFAVGLEDADYTPLWRMVEVVVPSDYESIDSTGDEAQAGFMDAGDLFGAGAGGVRAPVADNVLAFLPTDTLLNCPLQVDPPEGP